MKNIFNKPNYSLYLLPLLHILIVLYCAILYFTSSDPARLDFWMLLIYIDWPLAKILGALVENINIGVDKNYILIVLLAIFGTVWWYIISLLLKKAKDYFIGKI